MHESGIARASFRHVPIAFVLQTKAYGQICITVVNLDLVHRNFVNICVLLAESVLKGIQATLMAKGHDASIAIRLRRNSQMNFLEHRKNLLLFLWTVRNSMCFHV